MWKFLILCLLVTASACTGTKGDTNISKVNENTGAETKIADIQGQWMIENIVENDSSYVRPSDLENAVTVYIDFRKDYSFGINTNCNHISGQYVVKNDSIALNDISATEMAFDNMEIEDMLKKILPEVNYLDSINHSIARLNTKDSASYIVLKKMKVIVK